MLDRVVMVIGATLIGAPFLGASPVVSLYNPTRGQIVSMTNADHSRSVATDDPQNLIYVGYYFSSDNGLPLSITSSSVPDPVIPGTRIEVHRIAALLDGGADVDDILRDYPSLNRNQVESARDTANKTIRVGLPYPKRSLKSAFRSLALDKYLG